MFEIGKIVKPHGIKGAVKVFPLTTHIERFKKGDIYTIENNKYTIESIGKLGKNIILKFKGIDSIDIAETFRNKIIEIEEKDLIPLNKDEYYIHNILKSNVYDNENIFIGTVEEIILIENNNVLDIKQKDGKMITILFKNEFIETIDTENKKIVLKYKKSFYEF